MAFPFIPLALKSVLSRKGILTGALSVTAIIGLGWAVYSLGSRNGREHVQAQWDRDKLAQEIENNILLLEISRLEHAHKIETDRIDHELAQANETHAENLAALNADYTQRLRVSEQRAAKYQSMSQSGADQSERLASHAAELDRSLEEGRRLVKELGSTIEQRDRQLKLLGEQIKSDRELLIN